MPKSPDAGIAARQAKRRKNALFAVKELRLMNKRSKKKIAPIVVAALVVVYLLPIVGGLAAAAGLLGATEGWAAVPFLLTYILVGGAVIVGVLYAMGQRLRQQRNRLGLTREQFAELADIGTGYYGQIEVGTSQMSIDTLMKVARTSRLSMEYILFGEEGGETDLGSLETLLRGCTPRELRLAEKVLQLFLLRGD